MRKRNFVVSHVTMYLLINQDWGNILNQYMTKISFLVSHVTMYLLINQGWGHILNQYIRERSFLVSHVTTQKSSLKIHIKFPCHSWEYLFAGQSHLRTDINSVNEEKKLPCQPAWVGLAWLGFDNSKFDQDWLGIDWARTS